MDVKEIELDSSGIGEGQVVDLMNMVMTLQVI
jgi:hypothetical protein